jgi:hypothetical protein
MVLTSQTLIAGCSNLVLVDRRIAVAWAQLDLLADAKNT